ncbi:hypothetical protein J2D73_17400 [Acetobacter sacchari]|uniref:DUF551 domain-containing protein n=1 Tax=Acetobacter sacchari TaxID=2661687 RepID=A0ABS3M097_9PROT|nr:hypothetical protein [Acetobacter sacchari]MBO1361564.1 hypothetical protein [Acetobacter sacchari]
MTPTKEMVEAAARAMANRFNDEKDVWADFGERDRQFYRDSVSVVITAALAELWLPIEECPLNQDMIIAWRNGTVSVAVKCGDWWFFANGDRIYGEQAIVAFQPLPSPPKVTP